MNRKHREPVKKNQNLPQKSIRKGHYVEVLLLNKKGKVKLDKVAKQIDSAVPFVFPTEEEIKDIMDFYGLTEEDIKI